MKNDKEINKKQAEFYNEFGVAAKHIPDDTPAKDSPNKEEPQGFNDYDEFHECKILYNLAPRKLVM